jgi:hypothetical protein
MTDDHSRAGASDPRAQIAVALTTQFGLTPEAAATAAAIARLTAAPTEQEIEAEVQRLHGDAKLEDFQEGHAGAQAAFLRQYKANLLREREQETKSGTTALDERMAGGAGADAAELDRRLGPVRS